MTHSLNLINNINKIMYVFGIYQDFITFLEVNIPKVNYYFIAVPGARNNHGGSLWLCGHSQVGSPS